MFAKKSFTLAESAMKPCMEIAAREIHGGTIGCNLSSGDSRNKKVWGATAGPGKKVGGQT